PDRHARRSAIRREYRLDIEDILWRFDLGNEHGVGPGTRDGGEVFAPPWGTEAIHANHDLTDPVATVPHLSSSALARVHFGARRYRVLQIENDDVCGQRSCLVHGARVAPRHEQRTSSRTDLLDHRRSSARRWPAYASALGVSTVVTPPRRSESARS